MAKPKVQIAKKDNAPRLELAQKAAHIGTFEWDFQTNKVIWSQELKNIYGRQKDSFKGTYSDVANAMFSPDRKATNQTIQNAIKEQKELKVEYRIVWPDKSMHWLQARGKTFYNVKGKPLRMIGVVIDITDRKRLEDNLQFLSDASRIFSSSLDFQTTVNSVAKLAVPHIADWCAVDMLDSKGEIEQVALAHKDPKKIAWARRLRKKMPVSRDDTSGVPKVLRTGKPEFFPYISDEMLIAAVKNKEQLKIIRNLGISSAITVPLRMNKKVIGAITFVATESGHHFTKTDLATAQELANRASLALENARLYTESQNALKQRNEFISIASHELKTPVTSIKAYAQVLQRRFSKMGDQLAATQLEKMDGQLVKLTNLINDLLDITKIESGKIMFNEEKFDFDGLISEIVEDLQHTTDAHHIVQSGKVSKKVFGDKDRIGQVLTNLISNAIKYSPHSKKILVQVGTYNNHVKVCVKDYGVGISKEKQEKVFERFYRVSGPKEDTYPGLGLGLYISSEIVKRQGGRIWVESTENKGSTFCFTLPIEQKKH
ncbi:MAG TPA: ATP-binding protein [Candidatus Saccharimonadales bacterium]|nr:ATP-binding protein [Candidatus Saccharimonadales bacterium]